MLTGIVGMKRGCVVFVYIPFACIEHDYEYHCYTTLFFSFFNCPHNELSFCVCAYKRRAVEDRQVRAILHPPLPNSVKFQSFVVVIYLCIVKDINYIVCKETSTYVIIGSSPTAPPQSLGHLCETFSLNQVIEWEGWEHGTVSVYISLDEESCATHSVKVDNFSWVAVSVYQVMSVVKLI